MYFLKRFDKDLLRGICLQMGFAPKFDTFSPCSLYLLLFSFFPPFLLFLLPPAPLLELAEDKDVRQLIEVGRQIFTNANITV